MTHSLIMSLQQILGTTIHRDIFDVNIFAFASTCENYLRESCYVANFSLITATNNYYGYEHVYMVHVYTFATSIEIHVAANFQDGSPSISPAEKQTSGPERLTDEYNTISMNFFQHE